MKKAKEEIRLCNLTLYFSDRERGPKTIYQAILNR